jgi:quercetin dioxygenase-like cupin family protein
MWRVEPAQRPPGLQRLVDAIDAALMAGTPGDAAFLAGRRAIASLNRRAGRPAVPRPVTLPVCRLVAEALAAAEAQPDARDLARALSGIVPSLAWARRSTSRPSVQPFHDGHANAMIIGPAGLEERDDVWLGVSLMAPGIDYPEHRHPPEEVYLALTRGEWWNAAMDWTEPGPGGLIYNPPGILHAMRSGADPFLALWILPV